MMDKFYEVYRERLTWDRGFFDGMERIRVFTTKEKAESSQEASVQLTDVFPQQSMGTSRKLETPYTRKNIGRNT